MKMNLLSLLPYLALATAIPLTQESQQPQHTPSTQKLNETEAFAHQIDAIIAQDAAQTSHPDACPVSHKSKQCCTSINAMSDDVADELSSVVPLLKETKVTSLLGLQCVAMGEHEQNYDCLDTVMCCDGKTEEGSQSLIKTSCIPYDQAMDEQVAASSLSVPSALPSYTPLVSESSAPLAPSSIVAALVSATGL